MRTLQESLILNHLSMSDVIRTEFHDMYDDIIRLRIEPSSHLRIVYLPSPLRIVCIHISSARCASLGTCQIDYHTTEARRTYEVVSAHGER